ncbi:uncharacterized protein LOC123892217 [Trifolium pratense]|uniref:uncharacterized protein LOC123892217 n=1 Tax=Trifolium pratense TaxID=57577 RepID=UPI001E6975F2|nr:uncharacterized protein LOC123892217 [Trifolium pratense]
MWPHTKEGIYSVKSGYNLLRSWKNAETPGSTHSDPNYKVWKRLWTLPTIPRHKVLLWRIIQQALPVRSELSKLGIQCLIQCPRCLQRAETINHTFMHCQQVSRIWFGSKLGIRFDERQGNFIDWLIYTINNLNDEDLSYVAAISYGIWYTRNQKVFEDKDYEEIWVINIASTSIREYQQANMTTTHEQHNKTLESLHSNNHNNNQQPDIHTTTMNRWNRPNPGVIKINCDANLARTGRWGLGAVCRDSDGYLVAAATWELPGCLDPSLAEACVLYKATWLAIECCFQEVVFESDNSKIISLMNSAREIPRSYLGNFIRGIKCNKDYFRGCNFVHIKREANKAAHLLASLAHSEPNKVWLEESPSPIVHILTSDLMQ